MNNSYELALLNHIHGDLKAATAHYDAVIQNEEDHAGALLGIGDVMMQMGQLETAKQALRLALRSDKLDALTAYFLAQTMIKAGMRSDAYLAGKKAMDLEPQNAAYSFGLGAAYAGAGLLYDAEVYLERAARSAPDNIEILKGMAAFCCSEYVFAGRGIAAATHALKLEPDDPEILSLLSKLLWVGQHFDEAAQGFQKLHDVGRANIFERLLLGHAWHAVGEDSRAQKIFEELVENGRTLLPAQDVEAACRQRAFNGRVLIAAGRLEEARAEFREARERWPMHEFQYGDPAYLDDTPSRIDHLRRIVRGRDVVIMAHGPSLKFLEPRIQELSGKDVCYFGLNRFSFIETHLLDAIGAEQEVVAVTPPQRMKEMLPAVVAFLDRPSDNLLITSRVSLDVCAAPGPTRQDLERGYDKKLFYFDASRQSPASPKDPVHFIPSNTLSVLLPMAALAKPRRIFIFGADGNVNAGDRKNTHYRKDSAAFDYHLPDHIEEQYADAITADTHEFNMNWEANLEALCVLHDVPRPDIYIVNPDSHIAIEPKISIDECLSLLADPVGVAAQT